MFEPVNKANLQEHTWENLSKLMETGENALGYKLEAV